MGLLMQEGSGLMNYQPLRKQRLIMQVLELLCENMGKSYSDRYLLVSLVERWSDTIHTMHMVSNLEIDNNNRGF